MKRRFTEEQIIGILGEHAAGGTVTGDHPAHGVSEQSFYGWKAKHAGLEVSELRRLAAPSGCAVWLRRLKEPEAENAKPEKLLAEAHLDNSALKDVVLRKW